jgi:glycerol-3-phosphate acyltransferase PlsY
MWAILISAGIGYLLGSIPFGYLLVRKFRGADVRKTGSGNIGATNVARTSPALGLLTLLLDALKGAAAVLTVFAIFSPNLVGASFATRLLGVGLHDPRNLAFVAALAAVAGHIFPVWLGFRGGKGVATGLGSFLLLTPKAILLGLAIFIALLAASRLVAVASIAATASLPLLALWLGEKQKPVLLLGAASLLIIVKHHTNIARMLRGTETRFVLRRRKKRITKIA